MKKAAKRASSARRNLFVEIAEGMFALAEFRQGKRTLRTRVNRYPDTVDRLAAI